MCQMTLLKGREMVFKALESGELLKLNESEQLKQSSDSDINKVKDLKYNS